jgi:hypothetical protein
MLLQVLELAPWLHVEGLKIAVESEALDALPEGVDLRDVMFDEGDVMDPGA